MTRRFLLPLVAMLLLTARAFGADPAPAEPKSADYTDTVIAKAISFLPTDLKKQFALCQKDLASSAKPEAGKPDGRFGFASKDDEAARKPFVEVFGGARKAAENGKSVADLKAELGRVALYVLAINQPHRADKSSFDSPARPEFERKLDAACSTFKAESDGFQRVTDPAKFALETSAKAQDEAKKLSADVKKADELPNAVFARAANSLADVWQSLLTKPGDDPPGDYIGNKSSKKFHRSTCRHQPAEKNQVRFATRQAAVDAGYEPCKVCKP